jgi:hypothetical protein
VRDAVRRCRLPQQPVLGPRGEQAVGLRRSPRHEVVDENAEIRFIATQDERRGALHRQRRVDARHQPEPGRLLIPCGAVDLSREIQPGHTLGLKRRPELRGVDEVVFDRVPRADDLGVFEACDRPHHVDLDVRRKRRREPVDVEERG